MKHDLEIVGEDGEEVDNGEERSGMGEELFSGVRVSDELKGGKRGQLRS